MRLAASISQPALPAPLTVTGTIPSQRVGEELQRSDHRFQIVHAQFSELATAVTRPVAGVLFDLGVSSPQLDEPSRGFSIKGRKDGPLDLRMNQQVRGPPSYAYEAMLSSAQPPRTPLRP